MGQLNQYQILCQKAALDLAAARLLLAPGVNEPLTEAVLFHLQQAVEKLIKALLSANGIHYPKTHDIENLLQICRQHNIILPGSGDRLIDLSDYAVESRYELVLEPVDDINGYLVQVDSLKEFVEKKISECTAGGKNENRDNQ